MYEAMTADGRSITNAHIGCDHKPLPIVTASAVEVVQADGDELTHILKTFPNIPQPPTSQRVVRWFGDWAKFIAANVKWKN